MMRKFFSLTTTLLLAACSFAPPYQRPDLPVAKAWPSPAKVGAGDDPKVVQSKVNLSDWRVFLSDPRLQALVISALGYNRDMRIAIARVDEARALYGIVGADRLPTVNLVVSQAAARTPGAVNMTGKPLTIRRYDVALGVTAFELDFWGRVKNLDAAARASFLATDEARDAFRLSLIADVANTYFSVLELSERTALARTTLETRDESRRLVAKRREVGLAGDLDFLTADGAYESARAELASLERSRAAAENALTLLVGTSPEALPEGRSLREQGGASELPVAIPSEVLLRRPDVRAAEQKLIAANANIGAARAAFLPRIVLSLALGTASPALSGLFEAGSGAWSFAPVLTQPLFDAGRTGAGVDLAEARKVIAVAEYEKTLQQAFREVADLLSARDALAEQLGAAEAAEKAQTERLRLVDARYKAGVSSYLEVLDAQRETFAAQQAALQVRRTLSASLIQLYVALGGDSKPPQAADAN
ncbi:MAG: efflux transporter outer membrane subunit [Rhodocyclales bacterium]|nr:efflux transporter outer membrane subunit [Rhodocyclales bacterium]